MANLVITFVDEEKNQHHDLEVPDEISADEFVNALQLVYKLHGSTVNPRDAYMRMEYPVGLIKGSHSLRELGMRNGSIVYSGKR